MRLLFSLLFLAAAVVMFVIGIPGLGLLFLVFGLALGVTDLILRIIGRHGSEPEKFFEELQRDFPRE